VFKTVADTCRQCGRRMEPKRSRERPIATLAGGIATIAEEYYVCPRCVDARTGRRVISHSEPLRGIVPLNAKYGYDVEIEAGYLQYADNRQMGEIKGIFERAHGLSIPQSQLHELGVRFLMHMSVCHHLSAPALKRLFECGCVYHVDATCEAGRGMELAVKEGWTGIVLGAWKIPTENEESIRRCLISVVETFGEPAAFVSDLGNGMMSAIAGVIQEMRIGSRQLVCHTHFLKAVGRSVLEGAHQRLKSLFRERKTLAQLNRFAKEAGDIIKPYAAAMRGFVDRWQKSGARLEIPGPLEGVAVLRALAQWVILFGADCKGEGFPFALSHVRLFDRCAAAASSVLRLSADSGVRAHAAKHAGRLLGILMDAAANADMMKTVHGLKDMDAVFAKLRETLRLEKTDVYKQDKDKKSPDSLGAVARLRGEASRLRGALCATLGACADGDAQADAIRIVLGYLDQYEPYLFGHVFVTYDASGNTVVRLIERSNNVMEHTFRVQKHKIRRRTGAKNLGFVYERILPAAAMVANLENPAYQQAVMGNKARGDLADFYSTLDGRMSFRDTPMFQDDLDVVGGRLPKADKRIVVKKSFSDAIASLSDGCRNSRLIANDLCQCSSG